MLAALGVPGAANPLALTPTARACVLLVDGLGAEQLRGHADVAPYLTARLDAAGPPLGVGFPATTSTSIASLGTGLPPGEHGLLGFEVLVPPGDPALSAPAGAAPLILNALAWDARVDPLRWQPHPTAFQRAEAAGVAVTQVGPGRFVGSGLTRAAMRGGRYVAAASGLDRVRAAAGALAARPRDRSARSLVYAYYGELDAVGHVSGVESAAWRAQLAHVDRLVETLAGSLPPGSALWVTADHGMVDVPPHARVDLAAEPELAAGVRLVAGDPRARYLHTVPGAACDVLAAWRARLGGRVDACSRDEAIAAGWFGPAVRPDVRGRIGDVVVAARDAHAVVDSRHDPPEVLRLMGLHGSLSPAEQLVPLLEIRD